MTKMWDDDGPITQSRREVRRCQNDIDHGGDRQFWLVRLENGAKLFSAAAAILRMQIAAMGTGVAGYRDPESRCADYNPGTPDGLCESDGHYLCRECVNLRPEQDEVK